MASATLSVPSTRVRGQDIYFMAMSVIMMGIVFLGFAPSYFLAGVFRARLPGPVVHLHAAAFTGWIVLFPVQTVLIAAKNRRLHRALGYAGTVLAGAIVVLGLLAVSAAVRRGGVPPFFTVPQFIALNDVGVVLFGALVGCAVWMRRNGAVHKRLMLIATVSIMPPALIRLGVRMHWPLLSPIVLLALLATVVIFDIAVRRRPYAVTLIASALALSVFPVTAALGRAAFMLRIANWMQTAH